MAKKDFNLKGFLVENKLTRVSRDRKKLLNEGEGQDFDPEYWNSAEEKQESLEDAKSEGFSYDNPVEDVYIPDYSDPSGQNDQSIEMERCPKCGNNIENCLSTKDGKCVYCPECGDYFNTEDYYEWMCGEADYEEGMRDDYNDRD